MKALVTGATGFIGSHLVDVLVREGFDVTCLVRNASRPGYLEGLNVKLTQGDCTMEDSLSPAVKDADYVFHLAGLTKALSADDFQSVNVKGTENMVKAVLRDNPRVKRFLYLSSLAAVGPSRSGLPVNEESESLPVSDYGRTKHEGEKIVLAHSREMPVTVVRPPAVYGPRDKDFLVYFKMARAGIVPCWGKCYYSFIYIDDLIVAITRAALNREAAGETFFVSDGMIYSTDDIVDAISDAVGKRPIRLKVPRGAMSFIASVCEKVGGLSIINSDKVKEMRYSHWVCDTTKACSKLDFKPKVQIKEGSRWTADWYRIHRWL